MKRQLFIGLLLVTLLGVAAFVLSAVPKSRQFSATENVAAGDARFIAEVAETPAAQTKGLSDRAELPDGHAMLFVFNFPQSTGFWMKDMRFPIDIVWIVDDRVVGSVEHALPDDRSDRPIYFPPRAVTAVLEVPAGSVARYGIVAGSPFRRNVVE